MVRRTGALALIVSSLALVAATSGAAAGQPAVHPDNKPMPLAGHENGRLPPETLVKVSAGCEAYRAAAPSLGLLMATARHRGVPLTIRECYRPIDEQVAVRQQWTARGNSACAAPVQRDASGRPVGTSNHGWGKAADFGTGGSSLTFSSPGYAFLKDHAGRVGWNHPGWAEPGGSACPEAWHWEWVGDGGTMEGDPIRADVVGLIPSSTGAGYSGVGALGSVAPRGDAESHGDVSEVPLNWLVVGGAPLSAGDGYWLVASDGGVFAFGDAPFQGSTGHLRLNAPIVGMAPTPDGAGYWLVASDGGVFAFGEAAFAGSLGDVELRRPIVGLASTPTGKGYWLAAADGGVFAFGDARFHGGLGAQALPAPVVAVAATPDGGYWLAGEDGAVHGFGTAQHFGSMAGQPLNLPVVSMAARADGTGYWLVAADGGIFGFGAARFFGAV